MIASQVVNIRGIAEHGFTSGKNDFIDTRTVLTHPVVSVLLCNDNYHLEYHPYPGVPWYNLPKLHHVLKDEFPLAGASVYTSYSAFRWDFLRVTFSQVIPGNRLMPPHLREELCL